MCRILIVSLLALPFNSAWAGLIGAERLASPAAVQFDRGVALAMIGRSDVSARLQALGIDPGNAAKRVAAMTDEEIRAAAGQLDSLPAGAGTTSTWAVLFVIGFIVLLLWGWR